MPLVERKPVVLPDYIYVVNEDGKSYNTSAYNGATGEQLLTVVMVEITRNGVEIVGLTTEPPTPVYDMNPNDEFEEYDGLVVQRRLYPFSTLTVHAKVTP